MNAPPENISKIVSVESLSSLVPLLVPSLVWELSDLSQSSGLATIIVPPGHTVNSPERFDDGSIEYVTLFCSGDSTAGQSAKSVTTEDRRVIHLEFCNEDIPMGWLEKRRIS